MHSLQPISRRPAAQEPAPGHHSGLTHATHAVWPSAGVKVPVGQGVQRLLALARLKDVDEMIERRRKLMGGGANRPGRNGLEWPLIGYNNIK